MEIKKMIIEMKNKCAGKCLSNSESKYGNFIYLQTDLFIVAAAAIF